MNLKEIKQAQNKMEIVGKVIENKLELKKSKNGDNFIGGFVDIEVNKMVNGEKVPNRFKIKPKFTKEYTKAGNENKMFKSFTTVMEEYKPGDIVRINGYIDINEYYNDEGNLRQNNSYTAEFFSRLNETEKEQAEPKAIANIETVVQKVVQDEEGNAMVECFTVGYGGKMIPLKNVKIINSEVTPVNIFEGMYYTGTTGAISFELEEYVEESKEEVKEVQEQGFGVTNDLLTRTFDKRISQLRVTGASMPYEVEKAYSQEDIDLIIKGHEQFLEEQRAKSNLTTQQGFGEIKAEEVPMPEIKEENPFGGNPFA